MIVMKMILITILLLLYISFICCDITNLKVSKYIDIASQLVKIDLVILFRNDGPTQIPYYNFIMDPDVSNVYIDFSSIEKLQVRKFNDSLYVINFQKPLLPNAHGVIKVEMVYMEMINTLADRDRKERIVQYTGNLYFYSLYETLDYSLICHVNRLEILEISREPANRNKTDLKYEFRNIQPYSFEKVSIIYVNDIPFFVVAKLNRKIDVSHLGVIFIEDKVQLINEGPKLTEPYEPSIRRLRQQLHTYLPASAFNIKLFDEIGNNSKSSVIYEHSYITLRFEARYPLERSWKTSYVLQYNVPIYEYLRKSKSMFFLKMRVVDHILPNTIIREARTKVILPQDSEIVSVTVSGGIPRSPDELSDTALSFKRPTVVFIARNVPENFVPDFYITYKTPILGTFKPALLISFYIEIVLISCIAFRRIDMYLRSS